MEERPENDQCEDDSRRDFIKKGVYVAPLILTAAVRPAYAGGAYDVRTDVD